MNEPTNIQIINNKNGTPAFVVIPYDEYKKLTNQYTINIDTGVPSEVVDLIFDHDYTPIRAWREHLHLSQDDMAKKMGISQPAYSQHESSKTLRKTTRAKIALALGIKPEQLDF